MAHVMNGLPAARRIRRICTDRGALTKPGCSFDFLRQTTDRMQRKLRTSYSPMLADNLRSSMSTPLRRLGIRAMPMPFGSAGTMDSRAGPAKRCRQEVGSVSRRTA